MRPLQVAALFALSLATILQPATSEACSPARIGNSVITEDDTPDCLTISSISFADDGVETNAFGVQNGCDESVSFECVGTETECGPIVVAPGEATDIRVPSRTTSTQWTILDESGLVSFRLPGEWGDCGPGFLGCAAADTGRSAPTGPAGVIIGLLGLALARRTRG